MPLSIHESSQFAQFVRFASSENLTNGENSVARLDATTALGNRTIKAAGKEDSVHALIRFSAAKKANDEVRDLFRKAVADVFGGESKIPDSVKEAMFLEDYGKGRPLTARRILVVRAAIDAVKDSIDVAGDNKQITTAIRNLKLDQLPPEINDALDDVRTAMANRGGAGMPEDNKALLNKLSPMRVYHALEARAKETGCPLTRTDVRNVLSGMIEADQEVEVAKLSAFMTAMGAKSFNVSVNRVTTNAMMAAVPGLKAELKACKSGEDFEAAFQKYGPTIQSHLVIMGEAARCKGRAEELLVEEFVKATGRDANFIRENVPLVKFASGAADKVKDKIFRGAIKANSPKQIEAAYREAARAYVKERLDVAKQADSLKGVSDAVRESLKVGAFAAENIKEYKIAEYAPLAAKLDLAEFKKDLLREPFSAEEVAPILKDAMSALVEVGMEHFGAKKWSDLGVDGQQPFASIVVKCVLSGEPELTKVLAEHFDELFAETRDLVAEDEGVIMAVLSGALPAAKELAAVL